MQPEAAGAAQTALLYARSLQEGDWAAVVSATQWMQERLELVALREGPEAAEAARRELIADLQQRTVADNQLQTEGVEDQYVFIPGASLEVEEVDAGHSDLERPVAQRVWIRTTYPHKTRALRDLNNVPVHAITVGVNLSADGHVLKANVIGNLDIDWGSMAYGWPEPEGGG